MITGKHRDRGGTGEGRRARVGEVGTERGELFESTQRADRLGQPIEAIEGGRSGFEAHWAPRVAARARTARGIPTPCFLAGDDEERGPELHGRPEKWAVTGAGRRGGNLAPDEGTRRRRRVNSVGT